MKHFKPHQFLLLGILIFTTCQKPNTPPKADFNINPEEGNTDSVFTFDASLCTDDQDDQSTLQVHWDWENDGNWDTDFSTHKTKEHQYSVPGNYTIILEVKDVEGLINSKEKTLYVSPSTPLVSTDSIVNINPYSAQGGGNVISSGSSPVIARGICWSAEENPSMEDEYSVNGNGLGQFTGMLTNLSPNETYYVRAYATSNVGTSYGNQVSFSTESTLSTVIIGNIVGIGSDYIEVSGNITSDGGLDITSKGICYSIEENPNINDLNCLGGSGLGEFTCLLQGLLPYTNYYLKAYATNINGTSYSGQHIVQTIGAQPLVITNTITNITDNSATCGGQVTYDGGYKNITRGVCWSINQNPDINDNHTADGYGMGSFNSSITNLIHNTVYYVRAFAKNPDYTAYGDQLSFTTATIPTLITTALSGITYNSATCGGNITTDGGLPVSARGVCWSINQNPDISEFKTIDGNGKGSFTSSMTSLLPNTTYFVRAYATNSGGTGYGNELIFITLATTPTVSTSIISSIRNNSATCGGNVTTDGGLPVTSRGVCWSTNQNPEVTDSKTIDGIGKGDYTSLITGLSSNTTYYVRAYATNAFGTNYGNQNVFTTNAFFIDQRDGNMYEYATIGTQIWMAQNLRASTNNDGTAINNIVENSEWITLTTSGYCWYNNDQGTHKDIYGAIYNWYAVNTGKLCPSGWHIPDDSEWTTLINYLGGASVAGGKLKEAGTIHWVSPNTGATNESGFTALPGGYRHYNNGEFKDIGYHGVWWSSTEESSTHALYRYMYTDKESVNRVNSFKKSGISVRCVKD